MADTVIEFHSRECKTGRHENCFGKWQGLGFEINCDCMCGHEKNHWASASVEGPVAEAINMIQPSKEKTLSHD